jgi:hypothetical protein
MANFGGFEMETPQDVLARLAAQRSKVMVQGDATQQRSQNIESALDGLFGNPQVRQAQRAKDALTRAQSSVSKADGEDELDYQMRSMAAKRDAIADISPDVASQINMQLLKLGEEKMQRSRLKAQDARTEEEFSWKKKDRALDDITQPQTYLYNPQSGTAESFDLSDPSQTAAFLEAKKQPNTTVISPAQKWQLDMQNDAQAANLRIALAKADAAASGGGSKVELQRVENASAGLLDVYASADRIFQVIDSNPDVLTGSSAAAQKLDKVATELGAAGRMASGGKTVEGQSIDDWLKANSIQNTRMQGLVVGMAYSLAKANDPSGRISDKDLAAAVTMVGGNNPNPASIIANLNDNLQARSNSTISRIDTLDEPVKKAMSARVALLKQKQQDFNTRMSKYAQGGRGPDATGATPDADGWTTVNGVRIREKK